MSTIHESYLVGLFGKSLTGSLTPAMHEAAGRDHGLLYLYRPIDFESLDLSDDDLPRLIRACAELGFSGLNITYPFKQRVMPYLDTVEDHAAALGAVNTVVFDATGRTTGYNTDYSGYISGLRQQLGTPDLSKVVLLGVGGAGSAIAYALLMAGASELVLVDRDHARAAQRAAELARLFPQAEIYAVQLHQLTDALRAASGFAQCTPVGMHAHPGIPLQVERLPEGAWVSECGYLPRDTDLVISSSVSRASGC